MAKVRYIQGKKASYLSLNSYDPYALYFCTDTVELFKGDQLYSSGFRIIASQENLPDFPVAADGILYYCKNNGNGYLLSEDRKEWIQVIYGFDKDIFSINSQGLISVEAVPIDKVTGLAAQLQEIKTLALNGGSLATVEKAGLVKPGTEFNISEDGTLSLKSVDAKTIVYREKPLNETLDNITKSLTWENI